MYEQDEETGVWRTEHKNGDVTMVAVVDNGEEIAVLAADFDDELQPIGSEIVGVFDTEAEAEARAYRWMEANEKGVKSGGGLSQMFGSIGGDDA